MPDAPDASLWLLGLAAAFSALAIAGGLSLRLRLSAAPGYLLGGVLLGAWIEIPATFLHILTTIGAMLILFFLGLEFSPKSLGHRFKQLTIPAVWDGFINIPVAFIAAYWLDMGLLASGLFAISAYATSSAVVAQGLTDNRLLALPEAELCLGILVIEDLIMALLLPLSVLFLYSAETNITDQLLKLAMAFGFVALIVAATLFLQRPMARWLTQPAKDLTILASLAMLFLVAGVGESSGVSAAVGALLAGMAVAESGSREHVEELLLPHRELLAVGFFASIGAGSDWHVIVDAMPVILTLAIVTFGGKLLSGYLGAKSAGMSPVACMRTGVLLTPRGEFTLVAAALAMMQPWGAAFYNTVVGYVIVSAIAGAIAIRYNAPMSRKLSALLTGDA
ncbi:MAG: cation:proton antiporter [Mariprofundaceae bacterium]